MGYSGGDTPNPTYHDLGDHSESIEIVYDPSRITYGELLKVFWAAHDPTARSWSRQYRSAVFAGNDEQLQEALASKEALEARLGKKVRTEITRAGAFYPAEDYHQKYQLRGDKTLAREYQAIYPDPAAFAASTAAARVNGWLAGYGSVDEVRRELDRLGLSAEGRAELMKQVERLHR